MLLTDLKSELLTGIVKPVRNENKCLRCSICYQSCPFSTIKYFISKFSLEEDENGEKIVNVTVKASNLNEEIVMG